VVKAELLPRGCQVCLYEKDDKDNQITTVLQGFTAPLLELLQRKLVGRRRFVCSGSISECSVMAAGN
jgi:hypothetical protein